MLGAEYLFIDGYNVINSWKQLQDLQIKSLEHAREKLITMMASYVSFKGFKSTIIFNNQKIVLPGVAPVQKISQQLQVAFTQDGLTADSYIEKEVYELLKLKKVVFVVTNDWAEQQNILGSGAFRFSVRELKEDYARAQLDIKQRAAGKHGLARNELAGRINSGVLAKLEQMRRDKN